MNAAGTPKPPAAADDGGARVVIGLNAVLAAVSGDRPLVLTARPDGGLASNTAAEAPWGLPYGPFAPDRHRTLEIGLRDWVEKQTTIRLGYVEQLYTFGDKGREAPSAAFAGGASSDRIVSVGYLALASEPAPVHAPAAWRDWYAHFPWEDWRSGEPAALAAEILPGLAAWVARAPDLAAAAERRARIRAAFGLDATGWEEEKALDRYELMYEAGLVREAWRDRRAAGLALPRTQEPQGDGSGAPMVSDHRRILATAIGRLRGKLKYRPIVFEMTPPAFTLLELQRTVETICGIPLHKQNFRRTVENSRLAMRTGALTAETGGRPAALFRFRRDYAAERAATGLAISRLRQSPSETFDL